MASRSPSPAPNAAAAVAGTDNEASSRAERGSGEGDKDAGKTKSGSRSRSRSRSGSRQRSQSRSRSRSRTRSRTRSHSRSRSLTPRSRSRSRSRSYSRSPTPKAANRAGSRSNSRGRSLGRSRSRSLSRSLSPRSRSRSPPRKVQRRVTRSPSPRNDVSLNSAIKVGNLTRNVSEGHIREIFGVYGKIKTINFPINPRFRFNMGYAEIEYETREEAQVALEGWNGGQLDGEIVEVLFITKITKAPPPTARPVRSRVPLSPRRGGRARSPLPPPPPRRRGEDHYSPPRRGNFDAPPPGRRDYYSPPPARRRDGYSPPPSARRNFNMNSYSPRRAKGVNAAPLGPRMPRGRSPPPPARGRLDRDLDREVLVGAEAEARIRIVVDEEEDVEDDLQVDQFRPRDAVDNQKEEEREEEEICKAYDVSSINILNKKPVDSKTALDKIKRRRDTHNRIERRRRDCINQLIEELLPRGDNSQSNILRAAVAHIQKLTRLNEYLKDQIEALQTGKIMPPPAIITTLAPILDINVDEDVPYRSESSSATSYTLHAQSHGLPHSPGSSSASSVGSAAYSSMSIPIGISSTYYTHPQGHGGEGGLSHMN
ncbi:hypothetical protein BGX27_010619 [Mortierella sp. AM989]|nr:hypothetical protein BGX27_010619 [Mortierella sp. AM989]